MARTFLTNIDLNKNQLIRATLHPTSSAPSSPVEGQVYFNTTGGDKKLYYWDGTSWITLTAGATTDASTTVKGVSKVSVAPVSSTNPIAVGDNDARVTADQAAATASIRTIGTGALQAMAGSTTLSSIAAPTGSVSLNSQRITSLATPTTGTDAATKAYVDNTSQGLDAKASVRAATTANGALATAYENGDTIDGVTLATNDRILIKDQTSAQENGIYIVQASGAPVRAADLDTWAEVPSAYVWVEEGTANADTGWVSTANAGGTLDTTAMPWTLFTSAGSVTAGAGLTKTGNTIDVVGTANRISVAADSIDISTAYVGQATITTLGTIGTGVWQGTLIGTTYGGTGISNPTANNMLVGAGSSALTQIAPTATTGTSQIVATGVNTAVPAFKSLQYSVSIGDGSSTAYTVTHNLGTKDVICQVYDNATPYAQVEVDVEHSTTNTLTLRFAVAPASNAYRCVVMGLA